MNSTKAIGIIIVLALALSALGHFAWNVIPMTKSLILVSHGRFCEELRGSTEMIAQDNIYTVALLPEDGPEEFTAKFEAVIEGLDDFSLCGSSRWDTL